MAFMEKRRRLREAQKTKEEEGHVGRGGRGGGFWMENEQLVENAWLTKGESNFFQKPFLNSFM